MKNVIPECFYRGSSRFWIPAFAGMTILFFAQAPIYAADPLQYTVYLKKFELKNNTGQWLTVIEPDRAVDLASEEAKITFFNTTGRIPDGNYINFRLTFSETVNVQGRDGIHVTREGGSVELSGDAANAEELADGISGCQILAPSWASEGLPGTVKVHFRLNPKAGMDDAITMTRKNDLPSPLEVKKGSFIYALVVPDLDGLVQHAQKHFFKTNVPDRDAMFAWPPRRVQQVKLTVDDRSILLNPDEIWIEY